MAGELVGGSAPTSIDVLIRDIAGAGIDPETVVASRFAVSGAAPTGIANLAPNLLAGLSLTLALRLSRVGSNSAWIVLCLAAAGLAHLLDLGSTDVPSLTWLLWLPVRPEAGQAGVAS